MLSKNWSECPLSAQECVILYLSILVQGHARKNNFDIRITLATPIAACAEIYAPSLMASHPTQTEPRGAAAIGEGRSCPPASFLIRSDTDKVKELPRALRSCGAFFRRILPARNEPSYAPNIISTNESH